MAKISLWRGYSYGWITLAFFLISLVGHWLFGWFAFVDEQLEHHQPVEFSSYMIEMGRDTLENWQSEFLQLLWQVGGLSFLLYLGSPQSKEGSDRMEAKVDELLRKIDPEPGGETIRSLDARYGGRRTDKQHTKHEGTT